VVAVITAYILIQTDVGKATTAAAALRGLPGVVEAASAAGVRMLDRGAAGLVVPSCEPGAVPDCPPQAATRMPVTASARVTRHLTLTSPASRGRTGPGCPRPDAKAPMQRLAGVYAARTPSQRLPPAQYPEPAEQSATAQAPT